MAAQRQRSDKLLERMKNNPHGDWKFSDVETGEESMEKLMYPFMTRVLLPEEGGGYLIEFPDLPGCMSDGETLEEAIENGKDALQCWIEAAAEDGQEIPEPGSSPTWVQQVPTDVHIQLSKRAAAEDMSLSELVALILDQATDDSK